MSLQRRLLAACAIGAAAAILCYLYQLGHDQAALWAQYTQRLQEAGESRDEPMAVPAGGACGHHH